MNSKPMSSPETAEHVFQGIAAAPGIAVGPAYVYRRLAPEIREQRIEPGDVDQEIERLRNAVQRSTKELQKILVFAEQKLGSDSARIFEAQTMILGDAVLMGEIERRVAQERRNAEYIVADEIAKYKRLMLASELEYMHERAHDLDDVVNRIVRNIRDQRLYSRLEGEAIIVSETLTPADTVIFSRNQVLAYATDLGGVTSHAAILSRSLKIPAVVGLRSAMREIRTGDTVAVDGYSGTLTLNPAAETLENLRRKAERFEAFEAGLTSIVGLEAETKDHRHIELSANIEFPEELEFTLTQGSAGIGLFRTEGQLLGRTSYPDEREQFASYNHVAAGIHPHRVIFRTFDIGGDKLSPEPLQEANPFLGWRGIRLMLDRPEVFLTQLRAILRASTRGNVRLMYPMVSTIEEVRRAQALLAQAKRELEADGVPFDRDIKVGVMIEVPSAALQAAEIAREVDFLSIGTNDLIQYTLAVDRDNSAVAPLYQQFHPAVLRIIRMTIDAGHAENVWVGMCGEMAGDPLATILLVGMGLDEFSVIPSMLPEIKKIIRSVDIHAARQVAETALGLQTADEIRDYLAGIMRRTLPDIPLDS
jgi:phosphotransferase system enzyme I (PtsI)